MYNLGSLLMAVVGCCLLLHELRCLLLPCSFIDDTLQLKSYCIMHRYEWEKYAAGETS